MHKWEWERLASADHAPQSRDAMLPPPSSDLADLTSDEEADDRSTSVDEAPHFQGEPGPYAETLDTPVVLCSDPTAEFADIWNGLTRSQQDTLLAVARAWPGITPTQRTSIVAITTTCSDLQRTVAP
jgi:hypothetical protein